MPGYDSAKDKVLDSEWIETKQNAWIVVQLACYNNGPPKIGFMRAYKTKDDETHFAKLGRVEIKHVRQMMSAVDKLLEKEQPGKTG